MRYAHIQRGRLLLLVIGLQLSFTLVCKAEKRPFAVTDDIRLSHFGDPYNSETSGIAPFLFSPDQRYVVVYTERGLLSHNRPESTLRVYRSRDVRQFLLNAKNRRQPLPVWTLRKSTFKDGPIITHVRWLSDSTVLAFLARNSVGNSRLFLADLAARKTSIVTPGDQDVTAFDARDRSHVVYTVLSEDKAETNLPYSTIIGTGRPLRELLFPTSIYPGMAKQRDRNELWAVVGQRRFRILSGASAQPTIVYTAGVRSLALSPDGRHVITALPLSTVPEDWPKHYPSGMLSSAYLIKAGRQDLTAPLGSWYVNQYVLIDVLNGRVESLVNAPIGTAAGWWSMERAQWSPNGKSVVLSNTFLSSVPRGSENLETRPCVVVLTLQTKEASCVESLRKQGNDGLESGWRFVTDVHFAHNDGGRVEIESTSESGSRGSTSYVRMGDGTWRARANTSEVVPFRMLVKQDFDHPPVLTAADWPTGTSRVILDPNPWLANVELGRAEVFRWRDETGRDWSAGLYQPPAVVRDHKYPLVIQTHGFDQDLFEPSGIYPTAYAARELAAAGMFVLQMPECPVYDTRDEGRCNVAGFEAAVNQLAQGGLVDVDRVGIVGFSRTCFHTLQALTTSKLHFRAASITDGVNEGYFQYLLAVDQDNNVISREADAITGGRPFGQQLELWLQNSPEFNLDRVTTPLMVVALGRPKLLSMWEPYAVLRYLNKPVDLILLDEGTHILSNPLQRLISQGGTVDWFRFWLQDYEDPDPRKASQYERWTGLRGLHISK